MWEISLCSPPGSTNRANGSGHQRPRARRRPHGTLTTALYQNQIEHNSVGRHPQGDATYSERITARHLTSRHTNSHARSIPFLTPRTMSLAGRSTKRIECQRRREIGGEANGGGTTSPHPVHDIPYIPGGATGGHLKSAHDDRRHAQVVRQR